MRLIRRHISVLRIVRVRVTSSGLQVRARFRQRSSSRVSNFGMTLSRPTTAPRSREPSVDVFSTFVILSVVVAEGVLR